MDVSRHERSITSFVLEIRSAITHILLIIFTPTVVPLPAGTPWFFSCEIIDADLAQIIHVRAMERADEIC